MDLEPGFTGFLKIVSTDGIVPSNTSPGGLDLSNAYVPEAYYLGDTVYANRTVDTLIQVLRTPILFQVAMNIGIALNLAQALVITRVLDCDGKPAPGVRFEATTTGGATSGEPFTLFSGLPRRPDTPGGFVPTDATGQAGFANVPPGYVFVDAFVDATGTKINKQAVGATALPNQLTIIEVHARQFGLVPAAATQ